jgi:hypothetical protein
LAKSEDKLNVDKDLATDDLHIAAIVKRGATARALK